MKLRSTEFSIILQRAGARGLMSHNWEECQILDEEVLRTEAEFVSEKRYSYRLKIALENHGQL